jgi:hypothetical protein
MRDCPARPYGCSCTSSCRIEKNRKDRKTAFDTVMAKRNAATALMMASVTVVTGLVILSFIYVAMPESKRMALRAQEQITWNR